MNGDDLKFNLDHLVEVVKKIMPILWKEGIPAHEEEIQFLFWFWYIMRHSYLHPKNLPPRNKHPYKTPPDSTESQIELFLSV